MGGVLVLVVVVWIGWLVVYFWFGVFMLLVMVVSWFVFDMWWD